MCAGGRVWVLAVLLSIAGAGLRAELRVAEPGTTDYFARFGWSPSATMEVTGYGIYYGPASGQYTNRLEVGNVTDIAVAGFATNIVYYLAVAAHDDIGLESIPSNELVYSVPADGPQPPAISSGPLSQSVTLGGSATFTVVASGTAPISYQWLFNGAAIAGATGSGYALANVQIANAGNYSVQVTNAAGSVLSGAAALTVLEPPVIVSQPAAQSVAVGSNASFTVVATGTAPLSYQWLFNGAAIAGATDGGYTLVNVQATNAGLYAAQVTNTAGSVVSAAALLTVVHPAAPFQVLSASLQSGVLQLSVPTEPGRNYYLEYLDAVPGANWLSLPPVPGDGTIKILSDPSATNQSRYYRVRSSSP